MDNIIFNILCCLNVESYYWFKISSQTEVWGEQIEEDFFEKEFYKGDEFINIIKNKHRIIFLKIQAYLKECDLKNIHTYEEFVDSNCDIIILVYDYALAYTTIALHHLLSYFTSFARKVTQSRAKI